MIISTFLALALAMIFLVLIFNSRGTPSVYVDESNTIIGDSISEKGFFRVNGANLHYFIKGKNINNPILLYLHGGMPDYFLTRKHPTGLDEVFTVVWLDQRGAGMSANEFFPDKNRILDTLISDIKEVTELLEERFNQKKIYLMGHSGGTYLGVKTIEKFPELYKAYIGVAQISYQKLSEKLAYDYIKEKYAEKMEKNKVSAILEKFPVSLDTAIPKEYYRIRDKAMHSLGIGTMRSIDNVFTGIFLPSLLFNEYSFSDKFNLWKGKAKSGLSMMWEEIINEDLSIENTEFDIPIYFFHGIYDYTCSYTLSKDYFEKIKAPKKAFSTFENSAHSPIFEEPEKCLEIIRNNILD